MIAAAVLGLVLLLAVPAEALWRSLSKQPPRPQHRRYRATIFEALALLAMLFAVAQINDITPTALGLGFTLGRAGWIGFAIAVALIGGLALVTMLAKPDAGKAEAHRESGMLPESPRELRLFLLMTPLIGFAWEALYRGYLLWWLAPLIGVPASVLLASLAYGFAHGWTGARQSFGSFASALLFTLGYVLTGNLWWLVVIHIGLPLVGFLALYRARQAGRANQELRAT